MTGGQANYMAEQIVGDLIFMCLAWYSYFYYFYCIWMSYNLFSLIILQKKLGGGYNKGIKGILAVGRLPNTYKNISAS